MKASLGTSFKKAAALLLVAGGIGMAGKAARAADTPGDIGISEQKDPSATKNDNLLFLHLPEIFIQRAPDEESSPEIASFETCSEAVIWTHAPQNALFRKEAEFFGRRIMTVFSALTPTRSGRIEGPIIAFDQASAGPGSLQVSFINIHASKNISKPRAQDVMSRIELDRSDLQAVGKNATSIGPKTSAARRQDVENKNDAVLNDFLACIRQERPGGTPADAPSFSPDEPALAMKGP